MYPPDYGPYPPNVRYPIRPPPSSHPVRMSMITAVLEVTSSNLPFSRHFAYLSGQISIFLWINCLISYNNNATK